MSQQMLVVSLHSYYRNSLHVHLLNLADIAGIGELVLYMRKVFFLTSQTKQRLQSGRAVWTAPGQRQSP